ncbi:MAG: hypothetical protein OXH69_23700 [Acidobacteria bacterium]|nr:hypothetical protein [Acidobacteriota bacterium]
MRPSPGRVRPSKAKQVAAAAVGKGVGIIEWMQTDRAVLAFSLLAAPYFALLALDYYVFRLDSILPGVVRELRTISPDAGRGGRVRLLRGPSRVGRDPCFGPARS